MKIIKKPLINTLLNDGITPPKRASLKKLVELLNANGWAVDIKINLRKSTLITREKDASNG